LVGEAGDDLVLHIEEIGQRLVETLGPKVIAGLRVNELHVDAHPIAAGDIGYPDMGKRIARTDAQRVNYITLGFFGVSVDQLGQADCRVSGSQIRIQRQCSLAFGSALSAAVGCDLDETHPQAKIGVLYQNDATGKDYLIGMKDVFGAEYASMVIKEVSYEVSEPTVDSQVVTLQGSGADVFLIGATTKAAAQAIRKAYDIGWTPMRYLDFVSTSIVSTMKPAGLEKSKGVIAGAFRKDPTDARWKDDPGMKEWQAFCAKYLTPTDFIDGNAVAGFTIAPVMVQVLSSAETISRATSS